MRNKSGGSAAFDFKDWLGGGAYAQITAAVEFEAIAVDQVMRPRQVEEIGLAPNRRPGECDGDVWST